jgi:NitT/TauT family transport system substrate-binding protein
VGISLGRRLRQTLALGAVLSLAACSSGPGASGGAGASAGAGASGPAAASVRLLLPAPPSIRFYQVHLAEGLGYFAEEGLTVAVEATDGSGFNVQQIGAGTAEFGQVTSDPTILGFAKSQTFRAVYQFFTRNTFDLYVPADSEIQSVADMKGKTIGVPDVVGGEGLFARVLINQAKLQPNTDVQIQSVGFSPPGQVEALQADRVQALLVAWNTRSAATVSGVELRCLTCEGEDLAASTIIVPSTLLDQDPDLVARLGRALAKATLFAETNPDAALAVLKTEVPEEFTNEAFAKQLLTDTLEYTRPIEGGKYGEASMIAWENKMNSLLLPGADSGLSAAIDLTKLVTNELVEKYNDFDHEAVKKQAQEYKTP